MVPKALRPRLVGDTLRHLASVLALASDTDGR